MRRSALAASAALFAGWCACAAPAPVEELTVDLPPPPSAEVRVSTTVIASSRPPEPERTPGDLPTGPPIPPGLLVPGLPPGLAPMAVASTFQSTTGPLSGSSSSALSKELERLRIAESPGAQPVAPAVGGVFRAKTATTAADQLGTQLLLEQNKCYTFIAVTRGRADLSVTLELDGIPGLPVNMLPLAMAHKNGASVTLGPGASCFKMTIPIPMFVRVVVRTDDAAEVLLGMFAQ